MMVGVCVLAAAVAIAASARPRGFR